MKLIIASLLAALVSFTWGYVSWMLLGWHEAGWHDFKDEKVVAQVVRDNATSGRGIYMLPFTQEALEIDSPEEQKAKMEAHATAHEKGPYVYAIVRPGEAELNMPQNLLRSFIRSLIVTILIGGLMTQLTMSYPGKLAFAAAIGAIIGLGSEAQMWIWFELPTRELIVNMTDHFIEWTLAGSVLALFLGTEPTVRDRH
ncbi:hypothetical protein [Brevifollis gellanilyticus]|uniref:Uncharacterized protein n=1 Tax=Brevifollis gellanilyticus TaxID=748831 RepID=A0A512MFL6_9BACT|nr:hypothetical protein [Brevifollis gellanilyticus]GEP45517.1 hypothetical protein BGE01nite_48080 [Brevifollis gellanilyticus]